MSAVERKWKHYGLKVYIVDGAEYAVATEAQANKAATMAIEEGLSTFKADFLVAFLERHNPALRGMSDAVASTLKRMIERAQSELSENAGPIIRTLVGNALPALVKEAIRFDGRGHFLSPYNDEERDSDEIEGLPRQRLAYRLR